MTPSASIAESYGLFRQKLFSITNDLSFWIQFLKNSIQRYAKDHEPDYTLYGSIFATYDSSHESDDGWLKSHGESFQLKVGDLEQQRASFCNWMMNLVLVRVYNISEIMLLHAIDIALFDAKADPWQRRKDANLIQGKIKKECTTHEWPFETKNNQHLVELISRKNPKASKYLQKRVRIDTEMTWQQFFEWFGMLRNIVAHQHMMVERDALNAMKPIAGDYLQRHFTIPADHKNGMMLEPVAEHFGNFLGLANELVTNLLKFLAQEKNLNFLGLRD